MKIFFDEKTLLIQLERKSVCMLEAGRNVDYETPAVFAHKQGIIRDTNIINDIIWSHPSLYS